MFCVVGVNGGVGLWVCGVLEMCGFMSARVCPRGRGMGWGGVVGVEAGWSGRGWVGGESLDFRRRSSEDVIRQPEVNKMWSPGGDESTID